MKLKITHLTSAHPRYDTRIFVKECCTLAKVSDYEVNLVVADDKGYEEKNNVKIYDVGKKTGKLNRIFKTTRLVYKKAIALNSDVYHFHDPELIPIGLKLKRKGKIVIFDSHEDVPKQLLGKPYLNPYVLKILSTIFEKIEDYACKKFDYIVAATPFICQKFKPINPNSIDINNYPILEELENNESWLIKKREVCYIGGIAKVRGAREIVKAMELTTEIKLNLVGNIPELSLEKELKAYDGWKKVNEFGFLDRNGVAAVLQNSMAGLVTLHPIINYIDALPVKMFEYMIAGIPVITSDIPLWREIIEGNKCGICVDPFNIQEIADAITFFVENPEMAQEMGQNGKKAVYDRYNWSIEEQKLLNVYRTFMQ